MRRLRRTTRGGGRARRIPRAALLAAALAGAACSGEPEADPLDAAVPVTTAVVARRDFPEVLDVMATVAARPGGSATVAAPGPTRVVAVRVAAGDRVARGQPLVELDGAVWRAEARGADAAVAAAADARERTAGLVRQGILPAKDLEAADAALAAARASAAAAARNAGLAVLRAPLRGVVTRVDAPVGAEVDAGTPLVELVDPDALEAVLRLAPDDAARVAAGDPVTLTREGRDGRVTVAGGTVAGVGLTLDAAGSRTARVPFTSPPGSVALGEALSARVTVAVHEGALVVPAAALVPDEAGGFLVYVVDAARVAHARPVVVGARGDGEALLLSGVEAGDEVVVEGSFQVADGTGVVTR